MEQYANILILENNESLIETYITQLRQTQFSSHIKVVKDLLSYINTTSQLNPHLSILSSMLPGFGEVIMWIHRYYRNRAPFIIIGQMEHEDDFRESIKSGAYDYLALSNIFRLANSAKNALEYEILRRRLGTVE